MILCCHDVADEKDGFDFVVGELHALLGVGLFLVVLFLALREGLEVG